MKDPRLDPHRRAIAKVDERLIALVALRRRKVEKAWEVKASEGLPIRDPRQERLVLSRARRWAREYGVPQKLTDQLFRALLEEAVPREARASRAEPTSSPHRPGRTTLGSPRAAPKRSSRRT